MATKFISTLTLDKIQVHNKNSPSNTSSTIEVYPFLMKYEV